MPNLTVGQKLWFVPSRDARLMGIAREVEVVKIGRKWAQVEGLRKDSRIDIETLRVDGNNYSSPGRCYLSQTEYEETAGLEKDWADLYPKLCGRKPAHITRADLNELKRILRIM